MNMRSVNPRLSPALCYWLRSRFRMFPAMCFDCSNQRSNGAKRGRTPGFHDTNIMGLSLNQLLESRTDPSGLLCGTLTVIEYMNTHTIIMLYYTDTAFTWINSGDSLPIWIHLSVASDFVWGIVLYRLCPNGAPNSCAKDQWWLGHSAPRFI